MLTKMPGIAYELKTHRTNHGGKHGADHTVTDRLSILLLLG
jgi:hypothetical protein